MTFARQWFEPGSQTGISLEGLELEDLIQSAKYYKALEFISKQCQIYSAGYWHRQYKRLSNIIEIQTGSRCFGRDSINLYFSDFWPNFCPSNNQILDILSYSLRMGGSSREIQLTNIPRQADIVVFSCYGNLRTLSDCPQATRVLFLGENVRPRYDLFDYSLSFDLNSYSGKNIYCPLWILEIDWFSKLAYPDRITFPLRHFTASRTVDYSHRRKSVAFIGNNAEPFRRHIITILRRNNIPVDEYGSHTNPVADKIALLNEYKLVICPENSFHPGYTTEKLIHPFLAGCYMIYWGAADHLSLHDRSYILNVSTTLDDKSLVAHARLVLEKCGNCLIEPLFQQETLKHYFNSLTLGCQKILIPYS